MAAATDLTRQQLDELDALLQRLLSTSGTNDSGTTQPTSVPSMSSSPAAAPPAEPHGLPSTLMPSHALPSNAVPSSHVAPSSHAVPSPAFQSHAVPSFEVPEDAATEREQPNHGRVRLEDLNRLRAELEDDVVPLIVTAPAFGSANAGRQRGRRRFWPFPLNSLNLGEFLPANALIQNMLGFAGVILLLAALAWTVYCQGWLPEPVHEAVSETLSWLKAVG